MSKNKSVTQTAKKPEELSRMWLIPLVVAIAIVPLITVIHIYDCGLEENAWFSIGGKLYDFFLYYKAFFLRLVGVLVLFSLSYLLPFGDTTTLKDKKTIAPTIAIGIFGLVSLLSALLSDHKITAFFGGYEQFEGWFILLAYVVCFYLAFGFIRTQKLIRFLLDVLLIGATIVGILGTFQALGLDWIQSDWAKLFLTPELAGSMDLSHFNVKLNFDSGMSYVTLYNPNYVGSYVALTLPYAFYLILRGEKVWRRVLAAICSILLIVTLIASRSETGILGLMVGAIVLAILMISYLKKARPFILGGLALITAGIIAIVVLQPGFISKLFNGQEVYSIDEMSCEDLTIHITTGKGQKVTVTLDKNAITDSRWATRNRIYDVLSVTDESGANLSYSIDEGENAITLNQDGYDPLKFRLEAAQLDENAMATYRKEYTRLTGESEEITVSSDDEEDVEALTGVNIIRVIDWDKDWMLLPIRGRLMILNQFNRIDDLKPIEKTGFQGSYYFASRRGYIWSRTLPLLTDHLLVGAGADNFVYAFPNNDYVGKRYMGYDGQTITKPHNMYLQIWVQDGLPSLLAFLFLYLLFLVRTFRMCFGKNKVEADKGISFHSFTIVTAVATTAYIVVGLANDSTITVAPVYWVLLGAGYAAEAMAHKK